MSRIRIPVNLASEPFRRDRPILAASAALAVLMVGLLAVLVSTITSQREAARESREMLGAIERQASLLDSEQARIQAELRQPVNAAALDRTVFLNLLIQRKGISWTKLFADLEGVVPSSVRLVTVRPYVTGDNKVQLDMIVGAQQPEYVNELLKRFESSPVFGSTSLVNSQPPSQNEPLYRYRLSVNYAQKL
jgi:type IV pilus assembly protein PilN